LWRSLLRNRYLLPAVVIAAVGVGGMFGLESGAGAQGGASSSGASVSAPADSVTSATSATAASATATSSAAGSAATTHAIAAAGAAAAAAAAAAAKQQTKQQARDALSCKKEVEQISRPGPGNSGSPKGSSQVTCADGRIVSYGNSAITYKALPQSYVATGEALFEQNCSSCHLADAQGGPAGPSLIGVGPATVNFWVTTGRMPAATPLTTQAQPKPPRLTNLQANEIAAFINSLAPAAPFIPSVNVKAANLAEGASLFALNCAACHTITGAGDELAYGTNAPSLHHVTATQAAEAIRTGPGNMPVFAGNLSDYQVRDIVAYVTEKIQHPTDPGGAGLGGVGPVAEGFVALLFGVGGLMLVCYWIGDRS